MLENSASLTATTKKGFTPLHLAAKYGNMNVARLLLQKNAPVDAQGKVRTVINVITSIAIYLFFLNKISLSMSNMIFMSNTNFFV